MGKRNGVSRRLPGPGRIYPDLVRHPWDLSVTRTALVLGVRAQDATVSAMSRELRGPSLTEALRNLQDSVWGEDSFACEDPMATGRSRMASSSAATPHGNRSGAMSPKQPPTWTWFQAASGSNRSRWPRVGGILAAALRCCRRGGKGWPRTLKGVPRIPLQQSSFYSTTSPT